MTLDQIKHLSHAERRFNRWLGITFAIALVYAFIQHVLLADVAETFPSGAKLGELFYDLAIAYIGSFAFYVLVVVLPLRRDRRNIYRYLVPLFGRVVGEAVGLMYSLNEAAGVNRNPKEHTS